MKVAEYRADIDYLNYKTRGFVSIPREENRNAVLFEARSLAHLAKCLSRAECPRAKPEDFQNAEQAIRRAREAIDQRGLTAEIARLEEADKNLQDMAFGKEYR